MADETQIQSLIDALTGFFVGAEASGAEDDPTVYVGAYFYIPGDLPDTLFNREISAPGVETDFPEGVLGIRVDEDFWAVAALPLRFVDLPLPTIVRTLWPDLASEATYGPDSIVPNSRRAL